MCHGCWKEYGAPSIDTAAVREAARLIGRVYEHSCVGGGLHVIIDDWNIEGEFLKRYAFPDDEPEDVATENECLAALQALSVPERASALALHDGFWRLSHTPDTKP